VLVQEPRPLVNRWLAGGLPANDRSLFDCVYRMTIGSTYPIGVFRINTGPHLLLQSHCLAARLQYRSKAPEELDKRDISVRVVE